MSSVFTAIMHATSGQREPYFRISFNGPPPLFLANGIEIPPPRIDSDLLATARHIEKGVDKTGHIAFQLHGTLGANKPKPFNLYLKDIQIRELEESISDLDSDNDGMLDSWEMANELDIAIDDSVLDSDCDGMSNYGEFVCGTSPTLASSVLCVDASLVGTDSVSLKWGTVDGKVYTIESSSDLSDPSSWGVELGGIQGDSNQKVRKRSISGDKKFYRVTVE